MMLDGWDLWCCEDGDILDEACEMEEMEDGSCRQRGREEGPA